MLSHFLKLNNSESIHARYLKFYTRADIFLNCIVSNFGGPTSNIIDTRKIFVDQKFKRNLGEYFSDKMLINVRKTVF